MTESTGAMRGVIISGVPRPRYVKLVGDRTGFPVVSPRVVEYRTRPPHIYFTSSDDDAIHGARAFVCLTHHPRQGIMSRDLVRNPMVVRATAKHAPKDITAVIPYLAYARQDRKSKNREPVTAAMIRQRYESIARGGELIGIGDRLIAAGGQRALSGLVEVDPHWPGHGFTELPVDVITAFGMMARSLREIFRAKGIPVGEVAISSPDQGREKVAKRFAKAFFGDDVESLSRHLFTVAKERRGDDVTSYLTDPDRFSGSGLKYVVIFDDLVASGKTPEQAALAFNRLGIPMANIWLVIVHPVLTPGAKERLERMGVGGMLFTNSTDLGREEYPQDARVLDVGRVVAPAVEDIAHGRHLRREFYG